MNSNKLIIGKYLTLQRVLSDSGDIQDDILQLILRFCLKGVQHQLQDVRMPATKCLVELYKRIGSSIRNHFGELRPAQIELIEQSLAEVDGGEVPVNIAKKQQQEKITHNNPKGAQRVPSGGFGGGNADHISSHQNESIVSSFQYLTYLGQLGVSRREYLLIAACKLELRTALGRVK